MKGLRFYFGILLIMVSIASIIILYSISYTSKKEVQENITNMGADIINMDSCYRRNGKRSFFTLKDVYTIKREFKKIRKVGIMASCKEATSVRSGRVRIIGKRYPSIFKGWSGPFGGELWGVSSELKEVLGLRIKEGRFINDIDLKLKRRVCVVGNYIYNQLGGRESIGKKLEIRIYIDKDKYEKYTFTVIGGLDRKAILGIPYLDMFTEGLVLMENLVNLAVFVPVTTLQDELKKDSKGGKTLGLGWIFFQTQLNKDVMEKERKEKCMCDYCMYGMGHPSSKIKDLINRIILFCKERYGKDNEFYLSYEGNLIKELERQTLAANKFIIVIGIVSLIASMISILSMMLISVGTRISEIGIRRAVGARKKDIFLQFLKETLITVAKGGIGGIVLGLLVVHWLGKYTGWEMVIPIQSLIFSIGAMGLIGIISGLYPAFKATKIPPAQAVRCE